MSASQQRAEVRMLMLLSDAYGGHGGIATFNRDLLRALASDPRLREVSVLPRLIQAPYDPARIPREIDFIAGAAGGKFRYLLRLLRTLATPRFDLVWCGHINLLPLAWLAARRYGAPLVLAAYGIEVWRPMRRRLNRWALKRLDWLVAISRTTAERLSAWSGFPVEHTAILPCCVDIARFQAKTPRADLIARHRLIGKKVLLTVGRLAGKERNKGFDEVLEALPHLLTAFPNLTYLVRWASPIASSSREPSRKTRKWTTTASQMRS
jgi:phosphatidyl-myo-inositol dimannoside synthase